ncbi:MAG TPA: aminotransferase class V-fold PLP-dependent enzyme [Rhizomicrobium sp.]|nr:aminotransferase class V-fold PLP-dependent enzyme [Rhizomicrobium sp.]
MDLSRRALIGSLSALPLTSAAVKAASSLPDKAAFEFSGTYLNAAYTHPLARPVRQAGDDFLAARANREVSRAWPADNPRNQAAAKFAAFIGADAADIAVVPSTMEGENHLLAALGIDETHGVVTDAYHYSPSLVLYGELHKRGVPLAVVAPRSNRIELADIEQAIGPNTKLVAVSHVGSGTGFQHDLKALCDMAHKKGAYVYADIIQSVGAVPFDVKESGVDFCCCGTYKWLMGDFGTAFLFVRPDRQKELKRTAVGWRQVTDEVSHVYPLDPPGPVIGDWTMKTGTAATFEVSTPSWCALQMAIASLDYVQRLGVENIARHRQPLIARLQDEMPKLGFLPLTPKETTGPVVAFTYKDAAKRLDPLLKAERITISTYDNRIRISPSVYNDMDDIERLLKAVSRA